MSTQLPPGFSFAGPFQNLQVADSQITGMSKTPGSFGKTTYFLRASDAIGRKVGRTSNLVQEFIMYVVQFPGEFHPINLPKLGYVLNPIGAETIKYSFVSHGIARNFMCPKRHIPSQAPLCPIF